ncbi:MAG TPA: anti-sigma factor [Pseudonocardia sp.]|jgi:anti-sigma-K factor RskA|uniref:anti-sigma factor n=1 Tax=Pseudonocardia sp. TaxID=60912 RepID=UPI002F42DF44
MSPDVHTLTGAYALDALEELERRQFESHLAQCQDCAREVEELRATATRLAMAVAVQPPDRMWQRVSDRVAVTRQEAPLVPPALSDPPVTAEGPRARSSWPVRLTAAVAAAAAAAAVVLGISTVQTEHQLDAARSQLAQAQAQYGPVSQLIAAPDARADSEAGLHGGTVFALASRSLDRALLLVSDMPAPPVGYTYQAWLIGGDRPRSVGLVNSADGSSRSAPLVFDGLVNGGKIGLTVEPVGGSAQPTTSPVVVLGLPA